MRDRIKTVGQRRILYVMAAKPEYGPHLEARFEPLMTGVRPFSIYPRACRFR